jgi:NitT/TauT family transport system substrate-binding protein
LEIELVPLTRSNDAIPVLAKGDIDVALYAISPPLLNAIAKGVRIRLVAARDRALPDCGDTGSIYARQGITTVAGLKGKKVANGHPAGIVEFSLDSALKGAGLKPSDVEIISLRPAEAAAAMFRGEIDAMVGPELGNLAALKRPGITCISTLGRARPGFQFGYVSYGRQLIDAPVELGSGFLRAFFRGVKEFAAGATPRYMAEYAERSGLDLKTVQASCRLHTVPDGRVDVGSLETFAKWAYEKGYCEQEIKASSMVDDRFLRAVKG